MKTAFETTLVQEGPMCFIPLPFDPRAVFGGLRVPVKVTLRGHTYRSTIVSKGPGPCLPLRRSNREAAGLSGHETVQVTVELDREPREVTTPEDLAAALRASPAAQQRWLALSYSHQREHVDAIEQAKQPQTRARRIAAAVVMLTAAARPAAATRKPAAPAASKRRPATAKRKPAAAKRKPAR